MNPKKTVPPKWSSPHFWTSEKASLFEQIAAGNLTVSASGGYRTVALTLTPTARAVLPLPVTIQRGVEVRGHAHEQPLITVASTSLVLEGKKTITVRTYCALQSKSVPVSSPRSIGPYLFAPVHDGTLTSQGAVWAHTRGEKPLVLPAVRTFGKILNSFIGLLPNPTVATNTLLWYRVASLSLLGSVGVIYLIWGPSGARATAPALGWVCLLLVWFCEYMHGSGMSSVSTSFASAASIGHTLYLLVQLPSYIASWVFVLALYLGTTAAYSWVAEELLLAGPGYNFGEVPAMLLERSAEMRSILESIKTLCNTLGVCPTYLLMYGAVAVLTPRIRVMMDLRRGEDMLQCVLCAGVSFSAVICVFVAVTPTGFLVLPPPMELWAQMTCFTVVYGVGVYMETFAMALCMAGLGSALLLIVVVSVVGTGDPAFVPLDDMVVLWAARGSSWSSFSQERDLFGRSLRAYTIPWMVCVVAGLLLQIRTEITRRSSDMTLASKVHRSPTPSLVSAPMFVVSSMYRNMVHGSMVALMVCNNIKR